MKKIVLIILLMLFYSCSFNKCKIVKNGKYFVIHDTGEKEKLFYKNGKLEGKVVSWHKNGNMKQNLLYKNGNPEGKVFIYHENGNLSVKLFYMNGKLEGKVILWHKNGVKKAKTFYSNGKQIGKLIVWNQYGEEINIINLKSFVSVVLNNSYKSKYEKVILEIKNIDKNLKMKSTNIYGCI